MSLAETIVDRWWWNWWTVWAENRDNDEQSVVSPWRRVSESLARVHEISRVLLTSHFTLYSYLSRRQHRLEDSRPLVMTFCLNPWIVASGSSEFRATLAIGPINLRRESEYKRFLSVRLRKISYNCYCKVSVGVCNSNYPIFVTHSEKIICSLQRNFYVRKTFFLSYLFFLIHVRDDVCVCVCSRAQVES